MKVMKSKKIYKLLPNDLIIFNSIVWLFKPKDNTIFPFGKYKNNEYIIISKKEANRILKNYKYFQKENSGLIIHKITR